MPKWQKSFGKDIDSIESDPGYPLSKKMGFDSKGVINREPLTIRDLILPPGIPCRKTGEGGEDTRPEVGTIPG